MITTDDHNPNMALLFPPVVCNLIIHFISAHWNAQVKMFLHQMMCGNSFTSQYKMMYLNMVLPDESTLREFGKAMNPGGGTPGVHLHKIRRLLERDVALILGCDETDIPSKLGHTIEDDLIKLYGDAWKDIRKGIKQSAKEIQDELNKIYVPLRAFFKKKTPTARDEEQVVSDLRSALVFLRSKKTSIAERISALMEKYAAKEKKYMGTVSHTEHSKLHTMQLSVLNQLITHRYLAERSVAKAECIDKQVTAVLQLAAKCGFGCEGGRRSVWFNLKSPSTVATTEPHTCATAVHRDDGVTDGDDVTETASGTRVSTEEEWYKVTPTMVGHSIRDLCENMCEFLPEISVHYRTSAGKILAFMAARVDHSQHMCVARYHVQGATGIESTKELIAEVLAAIGTVNVENTAAGRGAVAVDALKADGAFSAMVSSGNPDEPTTLMQLSKTSLEEGTALRMNNRRNSVGNVKNETVLLFAKQADFHYAHYMETHAQIVQELERFPGHAELDPRLKTEIMVGKWPLLPGWMPPNDDSNPDLRRVEHESACNALKKLIEARKSPLYGDNRELANYLNEKGPGAMFGVEALQSTLPVDMQRFTKGIRHLLRHTTPTYTASLCFVDAYIEREQLALVLPDSLKDKPLTAQQTKDVHRFTVACDILREYLGRKPAERKGHVKHLLNKTERELVDGIKAALDQVRMELKLAKETSKKHGGLRSFVYCLHKNHHPMFMCPCHKLKNSGQSIQGRREECECGADPQKCPFMRSGKDCPSRNQVCRWSILMRVAKEMHDTVLIGILNKVHDDQVNNAHPCLVGLPCIEI